jgi:hypothetical protein
MHRIQAVEEWVGVFLLVDGSEEDLVVGFLAEDNNFMVLVMVTMLQMQKQLQ